MRIVTAALLAIALTAPIGAIGAADKQLQSVKGAVSYQHGSASAHKLAHSASVLLSDNDVAMVASAVREFYRGRS